MFGNKNPKDIFSSEKLRDFFQKLPKPKNVSKPSEFLKINQLRKFNFQKTEEEEIDEAVPVQMEHVELSTDTELVKGEGNAPVRRPLAHTEAMPKSKNIAPTEEKAITAPLPQKPLEEKTEPVKAPEKEADVKKEPAKAPENGALKDAASAIAKRTKALLEQSKTKLAKLPELAKSDLFQKIHKIEKRPNLPRLDFLKKKVDDGDEGAPVQMEHVDLTAKTQIVKGEGTAPVRRPLAHTEAMPKKKAPSEEKKKTEAPSKKPAEIKEKAAPKNENVSIAEQKPKAARPAPVQMERESEKNAPPKPLTQEEKEKRVRASLDGMYDVYRDPEMAPDKRLAATDFWRYALLFVCIFGFLAAGIFVFGKLFSYHRSYVINSRLQDLVSREDRFQSEYLKKSIGCVTSLTPQDILNGKKEETTGGETYDEKQQNLVNKIRQLKKINPDTAGWITIDGTVVNYPIVWTEIENYYLRHDFYGNTLASGTLFIDIRNSPKISENRNTVIYGHNMADGSMFSSLHDFASATVFHRSTIEIATEDGIYVYKPFSAHESDAYDNYFETDFESDEEFITFCEQMQLLSPYQTDVTFDKDSKIITLSTCKNRAGSRDRRYAVHAVLVKVIR